MNNVFELNLEYFFASIGAVRSLRDIYNALIVNDIIYGKVSAI
jgi:hypothetical protein